MTAETTLANRRMKVVVALGLTFAAGDVDIIGYLALYHIFTAHMTGTTVHLATKLVTGGWSDATIAGSVLAAFIGGSLAGRFIIEAGARAAMRTIASVTLAIEAALLVAFLLAGRGQVHTHSVAVIASLLAVLAAAMGMQTATLTRIGPLTVHTTFVTGMLNKLAQLVSHVVFDSFDLARLEARGESSLRDHRNKKFREAIFIFSIWCLYLAGAAVGTLLYHQWQVRALALPIALLVCAIAVDQFRPLSLEEEREQFER